MFVRSKPTGECDFKKVRLWAWEKKAVFDVGRAVHLHTAHLPTERESVTFRVVPESSHHPFTIIIQLPTPPSHLSQHLSTLIGRLRNAKRHTVTRHCLCLIVASAA